MSARRRRKPMARRMTETERRRLGASAGPEEQPVAFYDPEEAFDIFEHPREDAPVAAQSLSLFEVLPPTAGLEGGPSEEGDERGIAAAEARPKPRRTGSIFGWLFAREPARPERRRSSWDVVAPLADGDPADDRPPAAVDDAQMVIDDVDTAAAAPSVITATDPVGLEAAEPEAEPFADEGPSHAPEGVESESEEGAIGDDLEHHVRRVRRRRSGRAHRARPVAAEALEESRTPREPSPALVKARELAVSGAKAIGAIVAIIAVLLVALYGLVLGVNAVARWNAVRLASAADAAAPSANNLLVIGVKDGVATGFTALKAERSDNRVLGIAIPEGAFVEIPGQGFDRIGASYTSGPEVSLDTVSNYLGVSFLRYVVVDADTYQSLLAGQDVAGLLAKATATDLTAKEKTSLAAYFASVKKTDVWIAPLPVKPVAVGDQQYYEPERTQVADLLLKWWGVKVSAQKATPRVIVYNGVGTPGLAGLAAQQLIRSGFSVVNSGNAQNFNYKTTQILLYHGTQADAEAVRNSLGVGQIIMQSAPQELTDMIVLIGADYRPPIDDASTPTTQGAQ